MYICMLFFKAEPSSGRILVFRVDPLNKKLSLIAEKDTHGAVYSMDIISGKLLAAVNSDVILYNWCEGEHTTAPSTTTTTTTAAATTSTVGEEASKHSKSLIVHCDYKGHIVAYKVRAIDNELILVGDIMKSLTLLCYKPGEQRIVEVARDCQNYWVSSMIPISKGAYLASECSYGLYCLIRNVEAPPSSDANNSNNNGDDATVGGDDDRWRLLMCGDYNLGEAVNCFRKGSLVMRPEDLSASDNDIVPIDTFVWGAASGAIGIVARITRENYELLMQVEDRMKDLAPGLGGLSHDVWRSFASNSKTIPPTRFADGDLIEQFLDLPLSKKEQIAKRLKMTAKDLTKIIESLIRWTH